MGNWGEITLPKNPVAILRTPKHPCYTGSFTPPLEGPRILRPILIRAPFHSIYNVCGDAALKVHSEWLICIVNVGKYTSLMDPMGFFSKLILLLDPFWNGPRLLKFSPIRGFLVDLY